MRYQLRYIRAQRTRSSPGAKHDDSPLERDRTNLFVPIGAPLFAFRQRVLPRCRRVLPSTSFASRRRSRGSVGERPLHTRKVAGSIPAGTTYVVAGGIWYLALRNKTGVISVLSGPLWFSPHPNPKEQETQAK
jgi:hypothetical protein